MFFAQITSAPLNPNEISLIFGLVVTFLFYRQYKKYEQEMEKEEMIGRFLGN
jgi:predicted histidine transporter YuiF (NhaC family)